MCPGFSGRIPKTGDAARPQVLRVAADHRGRIPVVPRVPRVPRKVPRPMALRVTRPKAAPVDPREAAIAALAREDLAAYRTLFADTAAIASFHARYGARRAMLEVGLQGPAREAPNATAQR